MLFLLISCTSTLYSQWIEDTDLSGYEVRLKYINVVDSAVVWVIGEKGPPNDDTIMIFYRTSFQGWAPIYSHPIMMTDQATCIAAKDSIHAWIGTETGKIFNTTNGGNDWTQQVSTGGSGYINDIKFSRLNPLVGYAFSDPPSGAGSPAIIFKTTNGGISWNEFFVNLGAQYLGNWSSSCVTDSAHAWFGLNCQLVDCRTPKILYTTNGGINWISSIVTNDHSNVVSSIAFRYDNLFGMTSPFDEVPVRLYSTSNGGSSWNLNLNTLSNEIIVGISWVPNTSVWYYATYQLNGLNQILKSINNGASWSAMTSPHIDRQPYGIDLVNQNSKIYAWAITYQGMILKLNDSLYSIGISSQNNEVPTLFRLYQNYPNPFNPTTVISFDMPKDGYASLKIFNAIGQEVAVIIDGNIRAGSYQKVFNAAELPSGIYFYKFTADGFSDVRKMSLIK